MRACGLLLCGVLSGVAGGQTSEDVKPTLSEVPLGAEQIAIYRDFLAHYSNGDKSLLNVSDHTEPFVSKNPGVSGEGCLMDFKGTSTSVEHRLPAELAVKEKVRLVDAAKHQRKDPGDAIRKGASVEGAVTAGFAAGLFSFSEIVFDPEHRQAAFRYSFVCGGLCGNRGTVVYEVKDGKWTQSKRRCSTWIS